MGRRKDEKDHGGTSLTADAAVSVSVSDELPHDGSSTTEADREALSDAIEGDGQQTDCSQPRDIPGQRAWYYADARSVTVHTVNIKYGVGYIRLTETQLRRMVDAIRRKTPTAGSGTEASPKHSDATRRSAAQE